MERTGPWTVTLRPSSREVVTLGKKLVPNVCPITARVCDALRVEPIPHSVEDRDVAGRLFCDHNKLPGRLGRLLRTEFAAWSVGGNNLLNIVLYRTDYVCPKGWSSGSGR